MILPDEEARSASAKSTHAVDILAFVEAQEIPFDYFETPYYLSPAPGGEKIYALLREALRSSGKIGIAYVEIQARHHLAALIPQGQSLVLNTLRWASEPVPRQSPDIADDDDDILNWEVAFSTSPSGDDDASAMDESGITIIEPDFGSGENGWDEVEALSFFLPTNPHANPAHSSSRHTLSQRRLAGRHARSRARRMFH